MKVWVVTSGEYSDYCLEAVFSSEEKAKAWVAVRTDHTGKSDYRVEDSFEVDGREGEGGVWRAFIGSNGKYVECPFVFWKPASEPGCTADDRHVYGTWSCGGATAAEAIAKVRAARENASGFSSEQGELKQELGQEA